MPEVTRRGGVVSWAVGQLRRPAGEALLVGGGLALAYLVLRMSPIVATGAFHDDAIYLSLGKALAAHEGYRSIYSPGAPVQLKYPPGLPAIYAVLWWLGATLANVETLATALNLLVCGAAASFIWWIARARLALSVPLTLAFAISPFFLDGSIQYFNLAISEPYFVLVWAAALVVGYRLEDSAIGRKKIGLSLVLGLLIGAGTLIRVQTIMLVPAFALALMMRRMGARVVGIFATGALVPVGAWLWWQRRLAVVGPVSTHPDEAPYLAWVPWRQPMRLLEFFTTGATWNWGSYWRIVPYNLSGCWLVGALLCAGFAVLLLIGSIVLLRRHPALVLTTACVAALVLVWPFPQDRFVLPILPFAGLSMAAAAMRLTWRWPPILRRWGLVVLAVVVALVAMRQISIRRYAYNGENPLATTGITYPSFYLAANTRHIGLLSRWTLVNTSPNDIVLVSVHAGLYLYTGRQGVTSEPAENRVNPTAFQTPGEFVTRRILEDGVTVVALGNLRAPIAREIRTLQQRCPEALEFAGAGSPSGLPAFYRVDSSDRCLRDMARDLGIAER